MKLKFLLLALIIIWGSGCIAHVRTTDAVQVRVRTTRTVVRVVAPAPRVVVRHIHRHRPHRVVQRNHRHHRDCHHARQNNNNNRPQRRHRRTHRRRPHR